MVIKKAKIFKDEQYLKNMEQIEQQVSLIAEELEIE